MRAAHALAALAALGLAGCTATTMTAQPATSALTSAQPLPAPPAAVVAPAQPHALMTHCGISTAEFDGRHWSAVTPQELPALLPDPDGDGMVTQDFHTDGTMTVLADDLIRWTLTEPTVDGTGLTVDFVPAPTPTGPWCQ